MSNKKHCSHRHINRYNQVDGVHCVAVDRGSESMVAKFPQKICDICIGSPRQPNRDEGSCTNAAINLHLRPTSGPSVIFVITTTATQNTHSNKYTNYTKYVRHRRA